MTNVYIYTYKQISKIGWEGTEMEFKVSTEVIERCNFVNLGFGTEEMHTS